ncbi:hypothetical protein GI482_09400 [Bacillus sp. N3536]|nr:hypothetical protein GI482_09400 [Bacillus sp. N3536]
MDINEIKNLPDRITTGILISKFQNALYQYRNNVIEKDSFLLILSQLSVVKYVIDEAKFGTSQLGTIKLDGHQMSNDWLLGIGSGKSRILKAVNGDDKLATEISDALENGQIERVLSKVNSKGETITFRLDSEEKIVGTWP